MTFHHLRAPHSAVAPPAARQPGPVTLALRAMREAVTTPPAVGPVTEAIRTMRAADPEFEVNPDLRALRRALADRIEADLAVLDMLGGDADLEPSLCGASTCHLGGLLTPTTPEGDDREDDAGENPEEENEHGGNVEDEGEHSLGSLGGTAASLNLGQVRWAAGSSRDLEACVQDEPHDAEEDDDRDGGCGDAEGAAEQYGREGFHGYTV